MSGERTQGNVPADSQQPDHLSKCVPVPPIRSLSIREPIHFPSNSNLLSVTSARDDSEIPNRSQQDPSITITHAIDHLENLLEEVGRISHQLGLPADETMMKQTANTSPPRRTRRPSEDIVSKGTKYLVNAKRQPNVRFAELPSPRLERHPTNIAPDEVVTGEAIIRHLHGGTEGTKSAIAPPLISTPDIGAHEDHLWNPKATISRRRSTDDMVILEPRPIDSFRRSSSHANLKNEIKDYIRKHVEAPVTERITSSPAVQNGQSKRTLGVTLDPQVAARSNGIDSSQDELKNGFSVESSFRPPKRGHTRHFSQMFGVRSREASVDMVHERHPKETINNLRRKTHVDLFNKPDEFDVHDSCGHKPVARNWPESRKRFTATVACINMASLGVLIGVYAGEVPAIQYVIADTSHWAILGNVFLYCGLAMSTLLFWPLPLLHGRKPYTLAGLALALGLQIPQGVAVMEWRMPDVVVWRLLLLLCRGLTGAAFGLVTINLQASLLDVFGASLQSRHPHGEIVDPHDVRRHGGGMGLWLGAWSWCTVGPITVGFMIGTFITSSATVQWGFWTEAFVLSFVLLLNLIAPETRRSAFRRTVAEMTGAAGSFSRITRGEIKMHLKTVGPFW